MLRMCLVMVLSAFLFAGCGKVEKEVLIDSFEGVLNAETVDFGASDGSVLDVAADKEIKVCGEQSIKVTYTLKPSGYMWIARGYNLDVKGAALWLVAPRKIKWDKYEAIVFSMYGSKSGGLVAVDIKDADGEIWRYMINGNFEGWKEIVCPLAEFFVRKDWQPEGVEKNEVLDFPVMSFQFEPRQPGSAVYYFDCVKVVKNN